MMTTIKYNWEDCTIGFECPNCKQNLSADSQDEEQECPQCGLKYSLSVKLNVEWPKEMGE